MKTVRTVAEVREFRRSIVGDNSFGLVPTMGALHAGHLSLVKAARSENKYVAVSIFVNPMQFGPNEDLDRYPRTFDSDCSLLLDAGVDLLFAPEPSEIYPPSFSTAIDIGPLANRLDGASRPGHFLGVATVVAKLFNIFTPTRAYFGQKDAAQIAVIRKLVRDLAFPVEVVVCSTVREENGLALSSRNRFLDDQQRREALVLSRAISAAEKMVSQGERVPTSLLTAARNVLSTEPSFQPDYVALVDVDTLEEVSRNGGEGYGGSSASQAGGLLLAIAGWLGDTRLIDNVILCLEEASESGKPTLDGTTKLEFVDVL